MSFIRRAINWTHSSISDDKQELEVYQVFQNEIEAIKKVRQEYIEEEGREDPLLQISFDGKIVSLTLLQSLKESILRNRNLSLGDISKESARLEELYRERLKELESRIISLALFDPSNVYLSKISCSIKIINTLLKRYVNLIAIQRSGIDTINMDIDLKRLEDNILIRISEINYRLTTDTRKR